MKINRTYNHRARPQARIFTASMADVVFLLIVFFVLTYQTSLDSTKMQLPETSERIKVTKDAALISIAPPEQGQVMRVSTGKQHTISIRDDEELVSFIGGVIADNPEQHFVIKADQHVRYERVDTVLQALKDANASVVFLLSEQRVEE